MSTVKTALAAIVAGAVSGALGAMIVETVAGVSIAGFVHSRYNAAYATTVKNA